jgi:4-carboxymuconolactone decarboxylase
MTFNLINIEDVPENIQTKLKSLPKINVFDSFARSFPKGFLQFIEYANTVYVDDGKVLPRYREIGIMRIAYNVKAEYESYNHYYLAKQAGVTDEELQVIKTKKNVTELSRKENVICRVADEFCKDFKITDNTHYELYSLFDIEAATELIVCMSMYIHIACVLNGLRVELEDDTPLKNQQKPL